MDGILADKLRNVKFLNIPEKYFSSDNYERDLNLNERRVREALFIGPNKIDDLKIYERIFAFLNK
jgi:hypothetical protein